MVARSSGFPLGAVVGVSAAAKFDSLCFWLMLLLVPSGCISGLPVGAAVDSMWV